MYVEVPHHRKSSAGIPRQKLAEGEIFHRPKIKSTII
jgi:hypothetical protein